MKYKRLLITGGYGFIGSNFINYLFKKYDDIKILVIDKMTYAANIKNIISRYQEDKRFNVLFKDISNIHISNKSIYKFNPDCIINFAAETHVDRSIKKPFDFIKTNINGTFYLLDFALYNNIRFHQVSTDEVYGSLNYNDKPFTEHSEIRPSSPYSASKAAADMLCMSYYKTYKLPVSISRCSNNYGINQFHEKLIPLVIKNIRENKNIPIYGNGLQRRDWIHVDDHCRAIDLILNSSKSIGEIYNIGAENELTNIDVITKIINFMSNIGYINANSLPLYVEDRKGHDIRYAIDNFKIKSMLNFKPKIKFDKGLEKTIRYYIRRYQEDEINT